MERSRIKTMDENADNFKPRKTPLALNRCCTLHGLKREGVENMKQELTSKQHKYFSKMNQFKTDYLSHVLNCTQIYFQYVAMSKADMSFINKSEFIEMNNSVLAQRKMYAQNKFKYKNKKTLVLDLDETLILASSKELVIYDQVLNYKQDNIPTRIYLKFRPFLHEFLTDMRDFYELIIYTSAEQEYADMIVNTIEEKESYFAHRLYSTQCMIKPDKYLFKNLEILCENRDIKDILIVDNSVRNFSLSVRNGIPIFDYKGSVNDVQLLSLAPYLRKLAEEDDVRIPIKNDFAKFLLNHYTST